MSSPDERTGLAATALAPCWGRVADKLTGAFGRTASVADVAVRECTPDELAEALPFAVVGCLHQVDGAVAGDGLIGLSEGEARAVADLMMGGDGVNFGDEFGDLQVSAVAEALNQMADALAQGLGSAVGSPVSIVCEEAAVGVLGEQLEGLRRMAGDRALDLVTARVDVDGAPSLSFYHILQCGLIDQVSGGAPPATSAAAPAQPEPSEAPEPSPASSADALMSQDEVAALLGGTRASAPESEAPPPSMGAVAADSLAASAAMSQDEIASLLAGISAPVPPPAPSSAVSATEARPARFEPLAAPSAASGESGYELILDIPVQVSVELGRATLRVRDILGLGSGAIVELDKASGEPVDVLAGGRRIATGEVVVVDENFGVRILQILRVSSDPGTSVDPGR